MPDFKSLSLLALLLYSALTLTVADFKPALFHTSRPSGFYQVNTGSDNTGIVLAFGDLNGDQLYSSFHAALIISPLRTLLLPA